MILVSLAILTWPGITLAKMWTGRISCVAHVTGNAYTHDEEQTWDFQAPQGTSNTYDVTWRAKGAGSTNLQSWNFDVTAPVQWTITSVSTGWVLQRVGLVQVVRDVGQFPGVANDKYDVFEVDTNKLESPKVYIRQKRGTTFLLLKNLIVGTKALDHYNLPNAFIRPSIWTGNFDCSWFLLYK